MRRAQRVAALSEAGVHVLRHTFCSHIAMKGHLRARSKSWQARRSRLSGVELAEEVGDILDRIDVGRKYLRARQLVERATGIEPVSEAWEASVLPLY